jgi:hypothetical protein
MFSTSSVKVVTEVQVRYIGDRNLRTLSSKQKGSLLAIYGRDGSPTPSPLIFEPCRALMWLVVEVLEGRWHREGSQIMGSEQHKKYL